MVFVNIVEFVWCLVCLCVVFEVVIEMYYFVFEQGGFVVLLCVFDYFFSGFVDGEQIGVIDVDVRYVEVCCMIDKVFDSGVVVM